ncbi:glycosyltransferase family 8 protein [Streptococcus himalayensis]|uniref:Glycosyltransferase family 8 protein n=1 Tax=Streptococcus himalayensis TaxID=1888195 RepID=A0A917ED61_9STRE|nr:glycosyltransferase family 8 protein [Streptococcus himalayensis]GGE24852.1 hypothetical protein GCM10011510_02410 [Streptococcus himalayensis]
MSNTQKYAMNIVMAADYDYKIQVETVLKSILQHHTRIQFFLINQDYPKEWFLSINEKLAAFESCIIDKKVSTIAYKHFNTAEHISEATFYRYHIPELIEEDKVLYLDSDIVVVGDLSPLYDLDIEPVGLAATENFGREYDFNAGVLLINNRRWREKNVLNRALSIHEKLDATLNFADQDVLNELFKNEWMPVPEIYNMQIFGGNFNLKRYSIPSETVIIHYTTAIKPWAMYKKTIKARIGRIYKVVTAYVSGRNKRYPLQVALKNRSKLVYEQEWHQLSQVRWEELAKKTTK